MEVDEEFGKMTKKQTQAYTGMDDKEQKALYKKMKKDGNFDVKKNLEVPLLMIKILVKN